MDLLASESFWVILFFKFYFFSYLFSDQDSPDEGNIQKVIDAGLLSKLVEFMTKDDELQLQVKKFQMIVI